MHRMRNCLERNSADCESMRAGSSDDWWRRDSLSGGLARRCRREKTWAKRILWHCPFHPLGWLLASPPLRSGFSLLIKLWFFLSSAPRSGWASDPMTRHPSFCGHTSSWCHPVFWQSALLAWCPVFCRPRQSGGCPESVTSKSSDWSFLD